MKKTETRARKRSVSPRRPGARTAAVRNSGHRRGLPRFLRPLFWEYDFHVLSWERDWYLVTGRILARGGWAEVRWLRSRLGDDGLRAWFRSSRGRGLERRHIRYWELILDLREHEVDAWLAAPGRVIWDKRCQA